MAYCKRKDSIEYYGNTPDKKDNYYNYKDNKYNNSNENRRGDRKEYVEHKKRKGKFLI